VGNDRAGCEKKLRFVAGRLLGAGGDSLKKRLGWGKTSLIKEGGKTYEIRSLGGKTLGGELKTSFRRQFLQKRTKKGKRIRERAKKYLEG